MDWLAPLASPALANHPMYPWWRGQAVARVLAETEEADQILAGTEEWHQRVEYWVQVERYRSEQQERREQAEQ